MALIFALKIPHLKWKWPADSLFHIKSF